ncbi:MAG: hypothetical protein Q8M83_02190 [bacterium]|nr:hypothetical protein [bacterium]
MPLLILLFIAPPLLLTLIFLILKFLNESLRNHPLILAYLFSFIILCFILITSVPLGIFGINPEKIIFTFLGPLSALLIFFCFEGCDNAIFFPIIIAGVLIYSFIIALPIKFILSRWGTKIFAPRKIRKILLLTFLIYIGLLTITIGSTNIYNSYILKKHHREVEEFIKYLPKINGVELPKVSNDGYFASTCLPNNRTQEEKIIELYKAGLRGSDIWDFVTEEKFSNDYGHYSMVHKRRSQKIWVRMNIDEPNQLSPFSSECGDKSTLLLVPDYRPPYISPY